MTRSASRSMPTSVPAAATAAAMRRPDMTVISKGMPTSTASPRRSTLIGTTRGNAASGSTTGCSQRVPTTHLRPWGWAERHGLGLPALNGGMRHSTGVTFSWAPAMRAAPTAGRRGIDTSSMVVAPGRSRSSSRRPVASGRSSRSSSPSRSCRAAASAPIARPMRCASTWPARVGRSAGATSAWVPSMAPQMAR
ncbi:MAG: hypothetical protein R2699_11405 [Acidimicrobiales bacterium]